MIDLDCYISLGHDPEGKLYGEGYLFLTETDDGVEVALKIRGCSPTTTELTRRDVMILRNELDRIIKEWDREDRI